MGLFCGTPGDTCTADDPSECAWHKNRKPMPDSQNQPIYDESYYTRNNYAGYLERFERYEKMVQELEYELFRILKLNFKDKPVLDYGCGVGFVVRAFQNLGYKNVWGYDHSSWAIDWGREHLILFNHFVEKTKSEWSPLQANRLYVPMFDWELMTAFDVFEHMTLDDVSDVLRTYTPHHLLVRIPLTKLDGGKFVLPVSEADPTHITRLTRESWTNFFSDNGYTFLFNVNLGNIYDTEGVMCAMFRNQRSR